MLLAVKYTHYTNSVLFKEIIRWSENAHKLSAKLVLYKHILNSLMIALFHITEMNGWKGRGDPGFYVLQPM